MGVFSLFTETDRRTPRRTLFHFLFKADEQRYDACYKVDKAKKETDELRNKHKELKCKIFGASQVTLHQNDPINIPRGCSNVTMVLKVDGF